AAGPADVAGYATSRDRSGLGGPLLRAGTRLGLCARRVGAGPGVARAGPGVARAGPGVARAGVFRLARASAVVGRVEARALVVDRDGVKHAYERRRPTDLTALRAGLVHAVEDLEQMPVRTLVLVDRHGGRRLAARPEATRAPRFRGSSALRAPRSRGSRARPRTRQAPPARRADGATAS